MKHVTLLLLLLVLTSSVQSQQSVDAELKQLEREWNEAIVKKDFPKLQKILGDEFVYIDYVGGVNPKVDMLRGLKESEAVIEPFETEDVVVKVFGNTAIITGRFTQKVIFKGQTYTGQFRYTDVYIKRNQHWQAVAAHSSRIPDKK
jgi:ketosteroid isomerase-like protein